MIWITFTENLFLCPDCDSPMTRGDRASYTCSVCNRMNKYLVLQNVYHKFMIPSEVPVPYISNGFCKGFEWPGVLREYFHDFIVLQPDNIKIVRREKGKRVIIEVWMVR